MFHIYYGFLLAFRGKCCLFLAVDLSPTFLNTGTTDETYQQSGKQESFAHLLKSSVSI